MERFHLCIITPDGTFYRSSETFTRTKAELHMRNLKSLENTIVYIEFAHWQEAAA